MKINLSTKKSKLIILVSLFVVFTISGGYLLWRINQPETVAPEDSEAGWSQCYTANNFDPAKYLSMCSGGTSKPSPGVCYRSDGTCWAPCSCPSDTSPTPTPSDPCAGENINENAINQITTYNIKNGGLPYNVGPFPEGARVVLYYKSLNTSSYRPRIRFSYEGKNYDYTMPNLNSNKRGVVTTDIVVTKENDYVKLVYSDDNYNQGDPLCNPGDTKYRSFGWMAVNNNTCGSGFAGPPSQHIPFEKKSVSADIQWANSFGNPVVSRQCWADWREWKGDYDFNDYFLQIAYIEQDLEPVPVCDGGYWEEKPTGTYPYCDEISYSFVAKDSDGINKGSIKVAVNGDARANATQTTIKAGDKEVRVAETLSTASNCLEPGDYEITSSWADKKGATGSQCTLTATFTVLAEVKNPDWDISKTVVESCIDENTDNPKSKLNYVVTVRNEGEGVGQIISVEDTLDSKVLEGYIERISTNGQFHNGLIIWTLEGADQEFAPSESKSYTYSYIVPSDSFGFYENTVTAYPPEGSPLIANASITADCVISELPEEEVVPEAPTVPETGIFDDSQTAILVGLGLLVLGFSWTGVGRRVFVLSKGIISKTRITISDVRESSGLKKDINRKRNFEKKVVKD